MPLLNFETYSTTALALYCCAGAIWIAIYIIVIRNILKFHFAPVPALGMSAFLAHEIQWGYVFPGDTGLLFYWGAKAYSLLSAFILFHVLRRSREYFGAPELQAHSFALISGSFFAWLVLLYYLMPVIDSGARFASAALVQLVFSISMIPLLLGQFRQRGTEATARMSYPVAWLKLAAAIGQVSFVLLHQPEKTWLQVLYALIIVVDCYYIYLFTSLRRHHDVSRSAAA